MKTRRTVPVALLAALALALALALVGSSCSSVDPVALQVGQWQLSSSDFKDQLDAYADAYIAAAAAAGSEAQATKLLHPTTEGTWSTSFTSFLLNEQLSGQVAVQTAQQRGVEITQDDRDQALSQLQQPSSTGGIDVTFDDLDETYRNTIVEGYAARIALAPVLAAEDPSDDVLRLVYEANIQQFEGQDFDAVKDGIADVLKQNVNVLVGATLSVLAGQTEVYVDARYGQFDSSSGQIIPPSGADQPFTTDGTEPVGSDAGTGAQ